MSRTVSPLFCSRPAAWLFLLCLCGVADSLADVHRVKYASQGNYVVIEMLDNDLAHIEYGRGAGPGTGSPIAVSAMISKTNYSGPSSFGNNPSETIETPDIKLQVDKAALSISLFDKKKGNTYITTINPLTLHQARKGISATRTAELDVYGLGQQFVTPGVSDIDWDGRVREGSDFGNVMAGFNDGANGNTQIGIMYALDGSLGNGYALFLDSKYTQRWDFTGVSQWKVETPGDQIRFYLMTGPGLPDLRRDYMELTGYPPVPPKKMFGFWLSEYGYDNWAELEGKLSSLRAAKFPIDGFVLDLQWFGGVKPGSDSTRMGSLSFDAKNFPDAAKKIAFLDSAYGAGIMLIEEAYIGKVLPEYGDLAARGYLVKEKIGAANPVYLDDACTRNTWWGKGGMLDYTNDSCSRYWHDTKRKPLISAGVIGHWTDLGEPELFAAMYCKDAGAYADGSEADAHNMFNFKWLRGIADGYARNSVAKRPFMMSRSGAAGMQRFGAAMWSGDISSHISSLAAHWANQMHLCLSGIDYYGADIGGFHRKTSGAQMDETYTQWFAYGMLFDIPGRPHTENLCNCKETAPDKIGSKAGNLANLRLRYELIPYAYSLAHRAFRFGEPVMPPLVYYYQTDNNVRSMAHEKMIGPWLLAAPSAKLGEQRRDVYLPKGDWYDFHSHKKISSAGEWIPAVELHRDGVFAVPLYARRGAVIPLMYVDDKTMNALGKRSDNTVRDELITKVFPAAQNDSSEFTIYEDDGVTIAYRTGEVRTTKLSQVNRNDTLTVTVHPSQGTYRNAPAGRKNVIVAASGKAPLSVALNGVALPKKVNATEFSAADGGWYYDGAKKAAHAKSGTLPVSASKTFVFAMAAADPCASDYDRICIPGTGNGWNPNDPSRMLTREHCAGTVWKGSGIAMTREQYKFAADGTWKVNWGSNGKQDGPNFPPLARAGRYNVTFDEANPAGPVFQLLDSLPPPEKISAAFVCENGTTTFGISVYVVGNIPELGSWDPKKAIKLEPNGPYPVWTGTIDKLPAAAAIEWKCIKRRETGDQEVTQWEPGANNTFITPAAGSAGEQKAKF